MSYTLSMKCIKIVLVAFFISLNLNSSDIYKIKIMGTFDGETIKLPDGGNFNIFKKRQY